MTQGLPADLTRHTGRALAAAILIAVVFLLLAYGAYSAFTSQIPSGNDFYPRWRGTRALIREGRDPYSDEVTLEIQQGMYGRAAREDEDQVAFAYPLYVALLVLPFSFFPYPQAQALWMSFLVLLTLAAVMIVLRTIDWRPSPVGLVAISIWFLLFYPTARSVLLGQFSIVVLALLALVLWATQRGHPILAGCCLALTTIKPQMVFLLVPFLLLTALRWKNYKAVVAFFALMGILLLISSFVLPTWLPSFITGLGRYQAYTSIYTEGRSPLGVVTSYVLPSRLSSWATLLASLALMGYLLHVWIRSLMGRGEACRALFLTIIVTLLVPAQTGTTNQVLLLLPLTYWLYQWRGSRLATLSLSSVLLVGPWILFLSTFWQRNGEHAIMAAPLPLLTLAILWWNRSPADQSSSVLADHISQPHDRIG